MGFGSGVSGGSRSDSNLPSINPLPGIAQRIAAETLPGHRAVCASGDNKFWIADPNNNVSAASICGITTGSFAPGETAYARMFGELTDPSFNFAEGPVWLGPNGTITQTRPTSGNLVLIGHSAGPTTLLISIEFICSLSD